MVTDTEGIVLRQVKAAGGRRMISLFSKKYGKISVGTGLNEGGKNKTALAIRAFSYGRYELFKNRDSYNLNSGQVIKSYYAIGEDIDKYMVAAYVLELTYKALPEEMPQPKIFSLLLSFLEALEKREKKHSTLMLAYVVKLLDIMGIAPELDACVCCGGPAASGSSSAAPSQSIVFFSPKYGGLVCADCAAKASSPDEEALIYRESIGIIDIIKYFQKQPFSSFEKLALDEGSAGELRKLLREHMAYHLDIRELKSESFFQI